VEKLLLEAQKKGLKAVRLDELLGIVQVTGNQLPVNVVK